MDQLLEQLKWEFYNWCGLLSLDEIASNKKIVPFVERVERLLIARVGVAK